MPFAQKAILWWIPLLYLLISDAFYLRTYDSAQVKITLVQMGGVCTLALWVCRLLDEGRSAFSKTDLGTLAPFLAYFAYGIFSFLHAPYTFSSLDFFLRRVFYMTVPLIVIREFDEQSVNRLTRVLVWTTWITVGYGFLQWFDITFFPSGIGKGPDPFIWRQAFGARVFSTFGNPNFFADFLVLIFPVLVCQYMKTRSFGFIVLVAMLVWDLIGTQTKGAWIGFVVSLSLLTGTYIWFFNWDLLRRFWKALAGALLVLVAVVGFGIVHKLSTSKWTSVNFRLFTWEATWEMVRTQPLIGTGIGSFWVIYPAFRRPPIFHIEGKHNTETDHSENEFLEVLFDEGILGFGIFAWLIVTTCIVAYRSLGQMTGSLKTGQRAPPRAYDLLGYLVAFQGMLAHNTFDVSMRFVSSGIYFGLLSGVIVNLSRGRSLTELHRLEGNVPVEKEAPGFWDTVSSLLIWPARLAAWASLGFILYLLLVHTGDPRNPAESFTALQGSLQQIQMGGELLQWWIAWGCFLFCVLSLAFIFARIVGLSRNPLVPLVVFLLCFPARWSPLRLTWGFFRADVHHNIAIFFSKRQDWENALRNYIIVNKLNPAFVMASYFKGNVFNDRFMMDRTYNPRWGDVDDKPRNDYERAIDAYAEVRSKAPNYVQMHHQMGVLLMKLAQWEKDQAGKAAQEKREADARGLGAASEKHLDEALGWFELYRKHDPVFAANYYRIAQIHMMRNQYDKAIATYQALIDGKECAVDPKLPANDLLRKTILAYLPWYHREGSWQHLHLHEEWADSTTHLGNAYLMAGRLTEAEKAYKWALELNPDNTHARNNLQVLFNRVRQMGLMGAPRAPGLGVPSAPPAAGPVFQIVPSK